MDIRVSYADTDRMGVVYYANYLIFFERGRTEFMRELGIRYRILEEKNIFLPVMDAWVKYLAPAQYDDVLKIRTWIRDLGRASMTFAYELISGETGKKVAEGSTKHPFVNKSWKPIPVPSEVRTVLLPVVHPPPPK